MTPNLKDLQARLKEAAEKATPGPWIRSGVRQKLGEADCIMVGPDGFSIYAVPIGHPKQHAGAFCDAGYLAIVSPDNILALLAHIEKLEGALEPFARLATGYDPCPGVIEYPDDAKIWPTQGYSPTYGDARAARAALSEGTSQ